MKKLWIAALAGAVVAAAAPTLVMAQAKPAAKPAAAAAKGPTAEEKAMDRAVMNYKKNKGAADTKAAKKK